MCSGIHRFCRCQVLILSEHYRMIIGGDKGPAPVAAENAFPCTRAVIQKSTVILRPAEREKRVIRRVRKTVVELCCYKSGVSIRERKPAVSCFINSAVSTYIERL